MPEFPLTSLAGSEEEILPMRKRVPLYVTTRRREPGVERLTQIYLEMTIKRDGGLQ